MQYGGMIFIAYEPILEVEKSVCVLAKYMAIWRACTTSLFLDFVYGYDSIRSACILLMISSTVTGLLSLNYFAYDALSQIQIDFFIVNGRMGHDGNDNTFQVTYAFIHILSNIVDYFRREL